MLLIKCACVPLGLAQPIHTFLLLDSCNYASTAASVRLDDHGLHRSIIRLSSADRAVAYPLPDVFELPEGEYTRELSLDSGLISGVGIGSTRILEGGCFYSLHLTDSLRYAGHFFRLPVSFEGSELSITDSVGIQNLFRWMKEYSYVRIEIGVHTKREKLMQDSGCISCKRSELLKAILVGEGVDSKRIRAVGYGNLFPLHSGTSDDLKLMENDRVIIRIIGT